jgi:TPR repeat protein
VLAGNGVPADKQKGIDLLTKAASQGDAEAALELYRNLPQGSLETAL